jgi:hypothetical protein
VDTTRGLAALWEPVKAAARRGLLWYSWWKNTKIQHVYLRKKNSDNLFP